MTKAKPKTKSTEKQDAKVASLIEHLPALIGRNDPDLVTAIKGKTPKKD